MLTGFRRTLADRYFSWTRKGSEIHPASTWLSYVSIVLLSLFLLLMVAFVIYGGLHIGPRATTQWILGVVIAVILEYCILMPLKIAVKSTALSSIVYSDIVEIFNILESKAKMILLRKSGVMNNIHSFIHHYNPACRAAREFPKMDISRLLMLLNDNDFPSASGLTYRKHVPLYMLPFQFITALFLTLFCLLNVKLQDAFIDIFVTLAFSGVLLGLAYINGYKIAVAFGIIFAIVIVIALVCLVQYRRNQSRIAIISKQCEIPDAVEIDLQFKPKAQPTLAESISAAFRKRLKTVYVVDDDFDNEHDEVEVANEAVKNGSIGGSFGWGNLTRSSPLKKSTKQKSHTHKRHLQSIEEINEREALSPHPLNPYIADPVNDPFLQLTEGGKIKSTSMSGTDTQQIMKQSTTHSYQPTHVAMKDEEEKAELSLWVDVDGYEKRRVPVELPEVPIGSISKLGEGPSVLKRSPDSKRKKRKDRVGKYESQAQLDPLLGGSQVSYAASQLTTPKRTSPSSRVLEPIARLEDKFNSAASAALSPAREFYSPIPGISTSVVGHSNEDMQFNVGFTPSVGGFNASRLMTPMQVTQPSMSLAQDSRSRHDVRDMAIRNELGNWNVLGSVDYFYRGSGQNESADRYSEIQRNKLQSIDSTPVNHVPRSRGENVQVVDKTVAGWRGNRIRPSSPPPPVDRPPSPSGGMYIGEEAWGEASVVSTGIVRTISPEAKYATRNRNQLQQGVGQSTRVAQVQGNRVISTSSRSRIAVAFPDNSTPLNMQSSLASAAAMRPTSASPNLATPGPVRPFSVVNTPATLVSQSQILPGTAISGLRPNSAAVTRTNPRQLNASSSLVEVQTPMNGVNRPQTAQHSRLPSSKPQGYHSRGYI